MNDDFDRPVTMRELGASMQAVGLLLAGVVDAMEESVPGTRAQIAAQIDRTIGAFSAVPADNDWSAGVVPWVMEQVALFLRGK